MSSSVTQINFENNTDGENIDDKWVLLSVVIGLEKNVDIKQQSWNSVDIGR